ncbi:MAG: NYN domain-containing protein [Pseudomonadota bacterium]
MTVSVFPPGERTGVLVHEPTYLACAAAQGRDADPLALRRSLARLTHVSALVYFPGLPGDPEFPQSADTKAAASVAGFRIVEPPAVWSGSYGRCDWSKQQLAETAVAMVNLSHRVDHILLVSGDAAMTPLVQMVQRMGLRVSVLSSARKRPRLVADTVRRQADQFIEYQDLERLACPD